MPDDSSAVRPGKPKSWFQFRIVTILSWTAVVAVLAATWQFDSEWLTEGDISPVEFAVVVLLYLLIYVAPFTCVPVLIDHALSGSLLFNLFWRIWLTAFLGVHSFCMLMLANFSFVPNWKGAKGEHWFYYALDDWAGMTLWPIYLLGVAIFLAAIYRPPLARRYMIFPAATITCAVISFWYVIASVFFNFLMNSSTSVGIIPLIPAVIGVCYTLYSVILLRNRRYRLREIWVNAGLLATWLGGVVVAIAAKYPLAVQFYNDLPDEPPDCFIVTAAARGHRSIVGAWFDPHRGRLVNRQLLVFWDFERRLQQRLPRFHWWLRAAYSRIGPVVARTMIFRWQADLVYLGLKPVEWALGRMFTDCRSA